MKNQHSRICRRSGRVSLMSLGWLLTFCLLLAAPVQAAAPHIFADLYDDATLRSWQPGFQRDFVWNFENAVLPYLPPDDKKRLRGVKIEFPLRGAEGGIFEFYTKDGKVIMPVLSM